MATSLQTANYGFGKYAPDDVTSYLTDYNGAMDKIDGAIKGVSDVANEAKATSDSNSNNIAGLTQGLTATNKNVENLGKTQTAQQTEIDNLSGNVSNLVKYATPNYNSFTKVYDSANTITDNIYTVGSDGWVQAKITTGQESDTPLIRLALNDSSLFECTGATGSYTYLTSPMFKVKKGDIIKYTLNTNQVAGNKQLRFYTITD